MPASDETAGLSEDELVAIGAHLESFLGSEPKVFHELISDRLHLDLYFFEPTEHRPVLTVTTVGMSALPMVDGSRGELMAYLPPNWPLDFRSHGDEVFWPFRMLKAHARAPHEYGFAIHAGETMGLADPPEPLGPGLILTSIFLAYPFEDEAFDDFELRGTPVQFMTVIPLTTAEVELKQREGSDAFLQALDAAGAANVIDPGRPCAVTGARP